jgi:hypothetical protein
MLLLLLWSWLGLNGFLPSGVRSMETMELCAMAQFRSKTSTLEQYNYLQVSGQRSLAPSEQASDALCSTFKM